ncbi:DUF6385 domain-containing protein [Alicyclobacillus sp. SO9]|uniref:DUF6385 domain-containing protein n=1 Tax=Alicyclobacillus sp. SO9 TaxID=2665646 RepID=UPI001938258E|nr:DUF6385 domain-containing protein [Alicyclobacillus sp. SO9]QQE78256.1 hypothetical protein GI364_20620 [Alicyclobacillus sp. SO9]
MSQSKPRNQFSGRTVRKSSAKNALKKRQQVSSSTPKVQILDKNNKVVKQVQTDEYGRLLTVPVYKKRKQMPRTKIYGQYQKNTLPVRVDESGRLETRSKVDVHTDTLTFYEQRQTVYTFNTYTPLPFEDISHAVQYVYLVHNQGDNDAEIFVELATDNENVVKDLDGTYALSAGQSKILTPLQFSRFIRIQYRSKTRDMSTKLHIVFQAQQVSAQTDNDGNS